MMSIGDPPVFETPKIYINNDNEDRCKSFINYKEFQRGLLEEADKIQSDIIFLKKKLKRLKTIIKSIELDIYLYNFNNTNNIED